MMAWEYGPIGRGALSVVTALPHGSPPGSAHCSGVMAAMLLKALGASVAMAGCCSRLAGRREYDLVIRGGRVMDPESGLDAVRHVGISGGKIAAVSAAPLRGRATIDARGLVVAPGFIDLHAHGQDAENYALRAADGVTTALELEIGAADVDRFYAEREGKALINFGASVGHVPVRMAVMGDPPAFLPPATARAATQPATDAQLEAIRERDPRRPGPRRARGRMGIQYTAAASRFEILEVFREAARAGAPVHVHMRHNGTKEPQSSTNALEEVLAAALVTGARCTSSTCTARASAPPRATSR